MAGGRLSPPSWAHPAGTDRLGRDYLTQVMIGARIAMTVGIGATLLGGLIGTTLGVLAGFTRGGDWSSVLAATLDILIAFPTLLLAMLVVAASDGASLWTAILAIGLAMSAIIARLVRILTKRVLAQDYITAARCSGVGWGKITFAHVLPNIFPTILVALAAIRLCGHCRGLAVLPWPRHAAAQCQLGGNCCNRHNRRSSAPPWG